MKKWVLSFLYLLLLLNPFILRSQYFVDGNSPDSTQNIATLQKLGIRFDGLAFFKNNEYFHPLVEGYTLPGFHIQPRLYYDLDNKFSLEAGVHVSQFFGKEGLNSVDPLLRATYRPTQSFSILLGWLESKKNHKLIEPLYQWEKSYTDPLEYGVQFRVNNPAFELDTWIDWERYIELNDPFQEELTFGTTSRIKLFEIDDVKVSFPIQATVKHKGGQIISADLPLTSIANMATGFNITKERPGSFLKKLFFDFYFVGYADFSPQKNQEFNKGYGLNNVVSANISNFQTSLGYWRGHHFITPHGEPLFQSASVTHPEKVIPDRYVITFKETFFKPIYKDVNFGAYFVSYFDVNRNKVDYDYGIALTVSGDILFRKI